MFYSTSMAAVQQTYAACDQMRKLLQNHRVFYEERDVGGSRAPAKCTSTLDSTLCYLVP